MCRQVARNIHLGLKVGNKNVLNRLRHSLARKIRKLIISLHIDKQACEERFYRVIILYPTCHGSHRICAFAPTYKTDPDRSPAALR
jgi:hypothetical protein